MNQSGFIQKKIIKLFSNHIKCKMIAGGGGGGLIRLPSQGNDCRFLAGGSDARVYLVTPLPSPLFMNS